MSASDAKYTQLRGRCLQTLLRVQDAKDPKSHLSSFRAAKIASTIASTMNVDAELAQRIEVGVMLRDIGKIGIPDAILHKTQQLSPSEMDIVRCHPEIGVNILTPLLGDDSVILGIVRHHHERWDGKGYPDRLQGSDIALEARIVAVADAFIAMVSPKSYRYALLLDTVFKNFKTGCGEQWDPEVVHTLERIPKDVIIDIAKEQMHL